MSVKKSLVKSRKVLKPNKRYEVDMLNKSPIILKYPKNIFDKRICEVCGCEFKLTKKSIRHFLRTTEDGEVVCICPCCGEIVQMNVQSPYNRVISDIESIFKSKADSIKSMESSKERAELASLIDDLYSEFVDIKERYTV